MTNDELLKLIQDQNISFEKKTEWLLEYQAKHEVEIQDLLSSLNTLTQAVASLIVNAESDRKANEQRWAMAEKDRETTWAAIREMSSAITSVHNRVSRLEDSPQ